MESEGRKHPVHTAIHERFNTPNIVFVTVCTKDGRRILANHEAHSLLRASWQIQPTWLVGRYMVMPDHIHFFCAPAISPNRALSLWMKLWKSKVTERWNSPRQGSIWQRHHWDIQLRRGENYEQKWQYILNNPVRAGLVSAPEDWPYQGELNILEW